MCCETPYNVQTKLKSFANFLKLLIHLILLSTLVCHQLPIFCKKPIKEEKKIYEWTALPDETILQKAKETKSQNGLVVLERKSEIYIGGFLAWLMGYPSVTKEEFIRFLVVDENGLKNSDAEIEVLAASKVEDVEARTVLPDGKILNIDKDKDIEMLEVQTYKSSKTIFSAGKVKFPSPQIGAILDLHYKISSNSFVLLWLEPLAYKNLPTLKLNLKLIVSDNKIGWQVITLNTTKTNILNSIKPGEVDLSLDNIIPAKQEPMGPPSYYYQPYILAFANLLDKNIAKQIPANWNSEILLDDKWLPEIVDIDNTPFKPYWKSTLEDFERDKKTFLKGSNQDPKLLSSDLLNMPISERARKVFDLVETSVFMQSENKKVKNLSSGKVVSLNDSLKNGFISKKDIAYYIAYLFERYQIPYQEGIIINRLSIRFSPYIPNAYVFSPIYAIKISDSEGATVFLTGNCSMPFGALESQYQNSVFIFKDQNGIIHSEKTPTNNIELDKKRLYFKITVKEDLSFEGKVSLDESGNCANEIIEYLQKQKQKDEEKKKEKKSNQPDFSAEEKEKEELVKKEFNLINSNIKIEDWKVLNIPTNSKSQLKFEYGISGKAPEENAGDLVLFNLFPFLSGYTTPFLDEKRKMPVWFDNQETIEYEGEIIFPKGISIEDTPSNESFHTTETYKYNFFCEKGKVNDNNVLKIKFVYTHPLICSIKDYKILKHFYIQIAKLLNSKVALKKNENIL